MTNPRFCIVNTTDAPCRKMVCELTPIGYCYMLRDVQKHLRDHDGMQPSRPTSLEDFGFEIKVDESIGLAYFKKTGPSVATYEDGERRHWQDSVEEFVFPLVRNVHRKGKKQ